MKNRIENEMKQKYENEIKKLKLMINNLSERSEITELQNENIELKGKLNLKEKELEIIQKQGKSGKTQILMMKTNFFTQSERTVFCHDEIKIEKREGKNNE